MEEYTKLINALTGTFYISLLNNLSKSKSSNQGLAFNDENDDPNLVSGYLLSNCCINFFAYLSFTKDGNFNYVFIISS